MNKNNNYIYIHKRNDTEEVFYVGRGTGLRMFKNSSRSKEWRNIVSSFGFTAEIYEDELSFEEAHQMEVDLITNPPENWNLINKIIPSVLDYNKEFLSEYFLIDGTSPSGLVHQKTCKKTRRGQKAGTLSTYGYWVVRVNNKTYHASRVVVTLSGINIPTGYVVNHIDGNTKNNTIDNLEVVSQLENSGRCKIFNNKRRKDNTTGVPGVSNCTSRRRYKTSITIDGKRISKYFSYLEDTEEVALAKAAEYLSNVKESILN